MNKAEDSANSDDDLLPEYDLKKLRVRKFGPGRKSFAGHGVVLDPDVAAVFPDSKSVNEALRVLMRGTRESNPQAIRLISTERSAQRNLRRGVCRRTVPRRPQR